MTTGRGRKRSKTTIPPGIPPGDIFVDEKGNQRWRIESSGRTRYYTAMPKHIVADKLPAGIYWDTLGHGQWYTIKPGAGGEPSRKRAAGPEARLSDLHHIIEAEHGTRRDSLRYICDLFHASDRFLSLATATRKDYEKCREIVLGYATRQGGKLGDAPMSKWSRPMVQKLIDQLARERGPSIANHVLRYTRRVLSWGCNRITGLVNHAKGVEAATERQRRRCPDDRTYMAVLDYARQQTGRPYLWIVMELAYLLRLRGIEVITLTDAAESEIGIQTNRRKGSKDNITRWSPRLRAAWTAAQALRAETRQRLTLPPPPNNETAWIFISNDGDHLRRSAIDNAWQTMITRAIEKQIITQEQRFSLHDLKRKGVTNTKGTRGEKQQASGHRTEQMLDVYDQSIPTVDATE